MLLADLAIGDRIFLDANPFVYHFSADPLLGAACTQMVKRIETRSCAMRLEAIASRNKPFHRLNP